MVSLAVQRLQGASLRIKGRSGNVKAARGARYNFHFRGNGAESARGIAASHGAAPVRLNSKAIQLASSKARTRRVVKPSGKLRPAMTKQVSQRRPEVVAGQQRRSAVSVGRSVGQPAATRSVCQPQKRFAVCSAYESDEHHDRRHPPSERQTWAQRCERCAFALWCSGRRGVPQWAKGKPAYLGGFWGFGCSYCAAALCSKTYAAHRRAMMDANKRMSRCKQAIARSSKWAKFAIRYKLRAMDITNAVAMHAVSDSHRLAEKLFLSPHLPDPFRGHTQSENLFYSCPLSVGSNCFEPAATSQRRSCAEVACDVNLATSLRQQVLGSVDDPFRGKVPQVRDWLNVWADSISVISPLGSGATVDYVS